jgi:hypothetical protein
MHSLPSTPPSPDAQDAPPPGLPMTEVCQVGVVLRALLGVQGVVALGAAFDAAGPAQWLNRFLLACAVSVPALLAWLLVACSLRLRLPPGRRSRCAPRCWAWVRCAPGRPGGWCRNWSAAGQRPGAGLVARAGGGAHRRAGGRPGRCWSG